MSPTPLDYLTASGTRAATILPLTWATLVISILVCIVIAALLVRAIRRARARGGAAETRAVPIERGPEGVQWITIGTAISAVPLLVTLVWTLVAIAATASPPRQPALTLDVTGHQWWWEVRYDAGQPDRTFVTANEIHIPTGAPVLVRLHAADVIHSFWVPQLSGKTDAVPGQTNLSWLEADRPGRFRGQCQEYCGVQHAYMGLEVVAEPAATFESWRAAQLAPALEPGSEQQMRGRELVAYRCGLCHAVRGSDAAAVMAPDLTHLMSRRTIAATRLTNTAGNLAAWIENPQGIKPGSLMPDQGLSGSELTAVQSYLETLR